jgi:hypothetical protein
MALTVLGAERSHLLRVWFCRIAAERKYTSWRRTQEGRTAEVSLIQLRNKHQGRRCFVIGNGPSLNVMDLTLLRNDVTIGCNGLFLHFDKMGWVPTYYTVEDRLVAEDRGRQIAAILGTTKVIPLDLQAQVPDPDTLWINFLREYPGFPKFSHDFPARAFWGGTVTYLNIQLAVHLGCNPIYLIGVDHNYKTDFEIKKEGGRWTSLEADPNHFHPDYFGKGYRWHDPNVARMEQCYLHAKSECDRLGITIINATAGGRLEVFPREDYHRLHFPDR